MPDAPDVIAPRTALLSASDKAGLIPFARALAERGVRLISTGGTAEALRGAGLAVTEVSEVTGMPEMMEGRVKTLHPAIHAGLLARRDRDAADLDAHGLAPIDLLAVTLYPFEAALARGAPAEELVETIDVGGPAMIRAAAKNHAWVAALTDPDDHEEILADLGAHGGTRLATRRRLAARAFARTAAFDAAVAGWMAGALAPDEPPRHRAFAGRLITPLRYGENPHQGAAFYATGGARPGVASARRHGGAALSFNNIADADAALEAVAEIAHAGPACVIVKHANPCGAAVGSTLTAAFEAALDADRESAFGGVVALSGEVDEEAARAVADLFAEVLIAPAASEAALTVLSGRPKLRVLTAGALPDPAARGLTARTVAGGLLVQDRDAGRAGPGDLRVVTERAPGEEESAALVFAQAVCKHVRSNAIVLARAKGEGVATVGVGPGQTSRVGAVRIAVERAGERARGAVMASDAFFPFPDGVEVAARAGVRAVIQPGGSVRDDAVVAAADEAGLAMVLTGRRHFRH